MLTKLQRQVKRMVATIDADISMLEDLEQYESCKELLEYRNSLSDFVTGYCTWSEVVDIVYGFVTHRGEIVEMDVRKDGTIAWFVWDGFEYSFAVPDEEWDRINGMMRIKEAPAKPGQTK